MSAWIHLNARTIGLLKIVCSHNCSVVGHIIFFFMRSSLPVCFCLLQENWQVQWILSAPSNHNQWSQSIAFPLFTTLLVNTVCQWAVKKPADFSPSLFQQICPEKKQQQKKTLPFKSHIQHDQFLLSMPDWKEGWQFLPGIKCLNASSAFPIWTSNTARYLTGWSDSFRVHDMHSNFGSFRVVVLVAGRWFPATTHQCTK